MSNVIVSVNSIAKLKHKLFLHRDLHFPVTVCDVGNIHDSEWVLGCRWTYHKTTNTVALSPRTNYANWATATCRRNLVPSFVDRGV
jgi:hypothetical protein